MSSSGTKRMRLWFDFLVLFGMNDDPDACWVDILMIGGPLICMIDNLIYWFHTWLPNSLLINCVLFFQVKSWILHYDYEYMIWVIWEDLMNIDWHWLWRSISDTRWLDEYQLFDYFYIFTIDIKWISKIVDPF